MRNMFWTAGPRSAISLAIFLVLGLTADAERRRQPDAAVDALEQAFNISVMNLSTARAARRSSRVRKVPPFLAILA